MAWLYLRLAQDGISRQSLTLELVLKSAIGCVYSFAAFSVRASDQHISTPSTRTQRAPLRSDIPYASTSAKTGSAFAAPLQCITDSRGVVHPVTARTKTAAAAFIASSPKFAKIRNLWALFDQSGRQGHEVYPELSEDDCSWLVNNMPYSLTELRDYTRLFIM